MNKCNFSYENILYIFFIVLNAFRQILPMELCYNHQPSLCRCEAEIKMKLSLKLGVIKPIRTVSSCSNIEIMGQRVNTVSCFHYIVIHLVTNQHPLINTRKELVVDKNIDEHIKLLIHIYT